MILTFGCASTYQNINSFYFSLIPSIDINWKRQFCDDGWHWTLYTSVSFIFWNIDFSLGNDEYWMEE